MKLSLGKSLLPANLGHSRGVAHLSPSYPAKVNSFLLLLELDISHNLMRDLILASYIEVSNKLGSGTELEKEVSKRIPRSRGAQSSS